MTRVQLSLLAPFIRGCRNAVLRRPRQLFALSRRSHWLAPFIRGCRNAALRRPRQLFALFRRSHWLAPFIRGCRNAPLRRPRQLFALPRRSHWLTPFIRGRSSYRGSTPDRQFGVPGARGFLRVLEWRPEARVQFLSVRFTRPVPDFDSGIGRMAEALDCDSSHESSILSSRPNI